MLEAKVNKTINILRYFTGVRWGASTKSMIMLHSAIVRQLITYSLPALHGLSATQENRLHYMIARSLRICLGVPRPTRGTLVLAETKQLPLQTLREHETLRHFLRLSIQNCHPLAENLITRTGSHISSTLISSSVIVPDYTPWVPTIDRPPWMFRVADINTELPNLKKSLSTSHFVIAQSALAYLHDHYRDHIHVYTDGSTTNDGSTSAFVIPSMQVKKRIRLSHRTSSTAAELYAIFASVEYIKDVEPKNQWVICTDSKAALDALSSINSRSPAYALVYQVADMIDRAISNGHSLKLQWIPGHSGISGNMEADKLATSAHALERIRGIPFSKTDIKYLIAHHSKEMAVDIWFNEAGRQSTLFVVDPELRFYIPSDIPRKFETMLHRLRLNVAFTREFRYKINEIEDPKCSCGQDVETIEHLFFNCPRFDRNRSQLKVRFDILDKRPFTINKLLGPWPNQIMQKQALQAIKMFLEDSDIIDKY